MGPPPDSVTDRHMAVGPALLRLRKSVGFSQQKLADRLAVARSYISLIENGERDPAVDLVERWALACGGELVVRGPGGDALGELGEDERRLVEAWRKGGAEQRGLLGRVAEVLTLLDERDLAHLHATLDVAARGSSNSAPGGEVHLGRRSCG